MNSPALTSISPLAARLSHQRFTVAAANPTWDPTTMSHHLDAWAYPSDIPVPVVPVVSLQGTNALELARAAAAFEPAAISFATTVTRGTGKHKTTSRLTINADSTGQLVLTEFDLLPDRTAGPTRYVARDSREYLRFVDESFSKLFKATFTGEHKSLHQAVRNVKDDSTHWLIYGSTPATRQAVALATTQGWTGVLQSGDTCAINAAATQEDAANAGITLDAYNEAFALDALIASLSVLTTDAEFEHQSRQRAAGHELARAA